MDQQPRTLGIAGQLRSALASLPPARGLLPLILLLLVWQLVQPGPSPYFPGPSQWWTATLTLFSREHLVAAFGATTWTFLNGLLLAIVAGAALGLLVGISDRAARALQPLLEFMADTKVIDIETGYWLVGPDGQETRPAIRSFRRWVLEEAKEYCAQNGLR